VHQSEIKVFNLLVSCYTSSFMVTVTLYILGPTDVP